MEPIFKFAKGAAVKDVVTGFKGIIMARIDYFTGCAQYYVQPRTLKDGEYQDGRYFDEGRLIPTDATDGVQSMVPQQVMAEENGADIPRPSMSERRL